MVAVIREALRLSQTPCDPNHGVLVRAVAEISAVGQPASNSRAERAVQQMEDLVRTYKSAIEARMDCKLKSDHPLLRWIVEHAADVYNQYAVSPEGKTPHARLHGKNPKEKLVDFWERVLWHVPKRLRAKLDLRWRLGVYVGDAASSNEYYLALPIENVVKSKSIVQVIPSGRWDHKSLLAVQGIPGKLTMSDGSDGVDIEAFAKPS